MQTCSHIVNGRCGAFHCFLNVVVIEGELITAATVDRKIELVKTTLREKKLCLTVQATGGGIAVPGEPF